MRDDIYREIFYEFREVTADVSNGDVQGLLNLDEPVSLGDLLRREQIFLLGHLGEGVSFDVQLRWQHRVLHQTALEVVVVRFLHGLCQVWTERARIIRVD